MSLKAYFNLLPIKKGRLYCRGLFKSIIRLYRITKIQNSHPLLQRS